jgi:hypothetical protein
MPAHVEVVAADALPSTEGVRANEVEPRPNDAPTDDASAPGLLGGPYRGLAASNLGSSVSGEATLSDSTLTPGSSDIEDLGAVGLSQHVVPAC